MDAAPSFSPLSSQPFLLILKTGDTHERLRAAQGDFEHWIERGLRAGESPSAHVPLVVLDPRRGDRLPEPAQLAGVVISGSHAMVSDREAWSERSAEWLAGVVRAQVPVLGICYGHQLLARALGGEAGNHPVGLELGTVQVRTTADATGDPLLGELPAVFDAHVVHRQSALRLPEGAVALAGNAFEPHQAFRAGGARAWGVQFHPEFDEAAMRGYIDEVAAASPRGAAIAADAQVRPTPHSARLLARFAQLVGQGVAPAPAPSAA